MTTLTSTTGDAVARETAWLRTVGDGLPALLEEFGGPFAIVQGYWPRTPNLSCRSLYLMRSAVHVMRFAAIRQLHRHRFTLRVLWPAFDGDGEAEADQAGLDAAVDMVLRRIRGQVSDKTHGGRFLSAAEAEEQTVTFDDPARTLPDLSALAATITYSADDPEIIG